MFFVMKRVFQVLTKQIMTQISNNYMSNLLFTFLKLENVFVFLLLLFQQTSSSMTIYKNFYDSSSINDLNYEYYQDMCSLGVTSCGIQQILLINYCSSSDYDSSIYQSFELPPHYQITIQLKFWRIDQWINNKFKIYADHHIIHEQIYTDLTSSLDICGSSSYNDEIIPISKTFYHFSTSLFIVMVAQKGVWGISEFIITVENCPTGCHSCDQNGCFNEQLLYQQFNTKQILSISNNEGWISNSIVETVVGQCAGVKCLRAYSLQLIKTFQLEQHSMISFAIRVLILNSYYTEINLLLDDVPVYSTQYSQGWIDVNSAFEFCYYLSQRQIYINQYPHIKSQVKVTIQTIQTKNNHHFYPWMCIRDIQLFIGSNQNLKMCDDKNSLPFDGCFSSRFDCVEGCSDCIMGICLNCQIGWEYQQFDQTCVPICGDMIITHLEVCDDGNTIPQDGCYQCQFSCIQECQTCEFGQCLQCNPTFELSFNKQQCISICNNGLVSKINFIDKINYECIEDCQLQCQICFDSKCYLCYDGWELRDSKCYQVCGDGQVAQQSIEQCDDSNSIPDDGCFQCQFECIPYCQICLDTTSCIICQDNFFIEDSICKPICGDGIIIIGLEDCDDGNSIPYDGCYECLYQCSQGCLDCNKDNQCNKCDDQSILNNQTGICYQNEISNESSNKECSNSDSQINYLCNNYCGDGTHDTNEQCDDGNQNNLDGCSDKCQIEKQYNCYETIFESKCFLITSLTLQFINHTNPYQFVQASFTNYVKLNESISDLIPKIKFKIDDLSLDTYNITIKEVIPANQFEFKDVKYILTIQFYNSVIDKSILKVSIDSSFVDQFNFQVDANEKTIKLQPSTILTNEQLSIARQLYNFALWLIIGLAICSLLLIIFGDLSDCTDILDILQYQSFLRFINVKYPENVEIYFQSSDLITLQPILTNLQIISFFENIFGDYFLDSPGKLQEYNVNADLLNNLSGLFIQLIFFIALYLFLINFQKLLLKFNQSSKYFQYVLLSQSNVIKWFTLKTYYLSKKILTLKSYYNIKGFSQIFYANCWDLGFKVLLFLVSINKLNFRLAISIILSFIFIFLVIKMIYQIFQSCNLQMPKQKTKHLRNDILLLIKKLLFLSVLIGIQYQSVLQCLLLGTINFSYIVYLLITSITFKDIELITIIWLEAPVFLFTILNVAYIQEFNKYFNPNQSINYGFFQIGILIFGLLGPLVKCFVKFYYRVKPFYLKLRLYLIPIAKSPKSMFIEANK